MIQKLPFLHVLVLVACLISCSCVCIAENADTQANVFVSDPVVYAVGEEYQIMVPVNMETLMWVQVDDKKYADESNGVLRSSVDVHRMTVPMSELDAAKKYTVCFRRVKLRRPYSPETGEIEKIEYRFKPVPRDASEIKVYHLGDAHNRVDSPVAAGGYFGDDLDLLVLNGDIADSGVEVERFIKVHSIAGKITHGGIPVVYARGNHECRGAAAEKIADYLPSSQGNTYYTFKVGALWGLVLDCGEDKLDSHEEYGNTADFHSFRVRETKFIEDVIRRAEEEYLSPEIKFRLVICHVPFFIKFLDPVFSIEDEIYTKWCALLKDEIHPQMMLFAHLHWMYTVRPGKPREAFRELACPAVMASKPQKDKKLFSGAGVVFSPEKIEVLFTDQDGKVVDRDSFKF